MAGANVAHKINSKKRTQDVLMSEHVDFAGLLLSEPVQRGLLAAGFEKPSPIQLKAIPLGRCGLDLIVQAKSGTGKTCVFSVIALENIQITSSALQVLVLAPTREIAVQIQDVIKNIGGCLPRLACHTFIGGLPIKEDIQNLRRCQIAIGSPGRVKHLIEHGLMSTDSIRIFILDEADKLLEDSFQEQINWIYSSLPDNKQILALSATYPEYLAQHLTAYMRNPTFIRLNISDPALLGIKQYYSKVKYHPLPNKQLDIKSHSVITLLSNIIFKQCLIFSNLQTRAQNLCSDLQSKGWPTSCIAGSLDQKERLQAMDELKSYKCRVLISTDLTSRGIDAEKVDLVINLDVPFDHETYLHRIGRAGRFGSFGAAVSIVSEGKEEQELWAVERKCHTKIHPLPDPIPNDLVKIEVDIDLEEVISVEQIVTRDTVSIEKRSIKPEKEPEKTSLDTESVPADDKDNLQNNSEIFQDKLVQITEVQTDEHNDLTSNGHRDNTSSEVSADKVSSTISTSLKISTQNNMVECDTSDLQSGTNFKNYKQTLVENGTKTNMSEDLLFSHASQIQEENVTENGSELSEMYPSKQKYVMHDEHSSKVPANHQGNKITKNSRKSVNTKTLKQDSSKTKVDIPQETENNFKVTTGDVELEINVNQSNSRDTNLTKADSLDSPVVDVQDFVTSSVSFTKSTRSQSGKPNVEENFSGIPACNKPILDTTGTINQASIEGSAIVTEPYDASLHTFAEKHSKLKDRIEKDAVIKDTKIDLLKCCNDLVKSIQGLNIGQISSPNEDLSISSDTTAGMEPTVVETDTDLRHGSVKLIDNNSNCNNANTSLNTGHESHSGIVNTGNNKDASRLISKKSSTKRKGRTYEDLLKSFNEFQSSNTESKPCDHILKIKQDLQNAAKNSFVDENLAHAIKNLDQIYSGIVHSKKTDCKSVSVQTDLVKSAEALCSIGTQTHFYTSKLTNRMAVSSLTQFSSNQNSDHVLWNSLNAPSCCQEDSEVLSGTKFDRESKVPMCQAKNSGNITKVTEIQHGHHDRIAALPKGIQSNGRTSSIVKGEGKQIQYDRQDIEKKKTARELEVRASVDLDEEYKPKSKILVANQNGIATLSDVEDLSAQSSSNSDLSSSETESEISGSSSESSSVSYLKRKNKMEAVTRDNFRISKTDPKTKGVNQNQGIQPEMSTSGRNKNIKHHSTHRKHVSHGHLEQKSQKSHVTDETVYGIDMSQAPVQSDRNYTQAPAQGDANHTQAPADDIYSKWYQQYYNHTEGLSYSTQGREARNAPSNRHEQNHTKSRRHQENFDPRHAYSDQYQQYYNQTSSRKPQDLGEELAYSDRSHGKCSTSKGRKNQANADAENAYSNWYHQWYDWYISYYSNDNPYQYTPHYHYPYYYPYTYSYPPYSAMPFLAPARSSDEILKDSLRFAKIQKEYIKQMSK